VLADGVDLEAEAAGIVGGDDQPVEQRAGVDRAMISVAVGEERVGEMEQRLQSEFRRGVFRSRGQQGLHEVEQLGGALEAPA
jgi:hypothetical protein